MSAFANMPQVGNVPIATAEQYGALVAAYPSLVLLDVRERDEWDAFRAPGATFAPLSAFGEGVSKLSPNDPVLVICHSGSRSLAAAKALCDAGFDAANLHGGIIAWARAGLSITEG